ncbi:MAG: glycosyl hydrolase [Proteobacteria bacterium]|nr:glycosyl hydrolase [Pseudomonadota bacterium]
MKEKIDKLVNELTVEEKASLCSGQGLWKTKPVKRLDLPSVLLTDGPHGVRYAKLLNPKPSTAFPCASAMAATWNRDLIRQVGETIGDEGQHYDVQVVLGPGVNLKRSPLGGRNFEYYSEDPYLSAEIGVSFVEGVQSKGVGTSVKHFVCNETEFRRFTMNAMVDERPLRELYYYPFEQIVKRTQPWTIMASYNRVNGVFSSENRQLLTEILRDEWGFQGLVVSDWGSVNERVEAVVAGLDLEMPGPAKRRTREIVEAVSSGKLDRAVLDTCVRRVLTLVHKGLEGRKSGFKVDFKKNHEVARKVAAESAVLLKNQEKILPLDADAIGSIAVIGEMAKKPYYCGGGSSILNPAVEDIPLDEIKMQVKSGTKVTYAAGYDQKDNDSPALIKEAVAAAKTAEVAIVFARLGHDVETEGYDRTHLSLSGQQLKLIKQVAAVQPNTIVVVTNGSAIDFRDWIGDVKAVLEVWQGGQGMGRAAADIVFGKVNPSGKLSETFPLKLADEPSHIGPPNDLNEMVYGEGLFIGYRYYDKKEKDVLFPFGYGLSYTTFDYSDLKLDQERIGETDSLQVSFKVKNTGAVAGSEVAQVYVSDRESRLVRPLQELKGFAKVRLDTGQEKEVALTLIPRDFQYYDPTFKAWVSETGDFEVRIGASSRDIRLEGAVQMESKQEFRRTFHRESLIKEVLADKKGAEAVSRLVSQPPFSDMMSERSGDSSPMFMNLPVSRLIGLSGGVFNEEAIDRLLEELN